MENTSILPTRHFVSTLLTVIQDPDDLAWELYLGDIITAHERKAACYHMHGRSMRTSSMLSAVESKIEVDLGKFDVLLSTLAKQPNEGHV